MLTSLLFLPTLVSVSLAAYENISITSSGLQRYYLKSLPPNFSKDTPTALILSYHGGTRQAEDQYNLDRLWTKYFNDFAIVVYPNGIDEVWQGVPNVTTKDTQLTLDIISSLSSIYKIDASRIYATGKSDGGGFVGVLACDAVLSAKIAAFAPVSGAFYTKNETKCQPATIDVPCHNARKNIPFLEFHGGNDITIKYQGAGRKHECEPSIPNYITQWAVRDELGSTNHTAPLKGTTDTTVYTWGQGEEKGLVSHIYDESIGHDWPATIANADNIRKDHKPADFNASSIIIDFFKKYTLKE